MYKYAQTNIQLYNELSHCGYSDADLLRCEQAYQLALSLFGGLVRPNGKVFLCHLVGTASILASHGASCNAVIAGLLHAAYSHDVYGVAYPSMTDKKCRQLVAVVGREVESIIQTYTRLHNDHRRLLDFSENIKGAGGVERAAISIHLANELEDHLYGGMGYASKTKPGHDRESYLALLNNLAGQLSSRALAAEIEEAVLYTDVTSIPPVLVSTRKSSYLPEKLLYPSAPRRTLQFARRVYAGGCKRFQEIYQKCVGERL